MQGMIEDATATLGLSFGFGQRTTRPVRDHREELDLSSTRTSVHDDAAEIRSSIFSVARRRLRANTPELG
jgi:hypothetical protein